MEIFWGFVGAVGVLGLWLAVPGSMAVAFYELFVLQKVRSKTVAGVILALAIPTLLLAIVNQHQ